MGSGWFHLMEGVSLEGVGGAGQMPQVWGPSPTWPSKSVMIWGVNAKDKLTGIQRTCLTVGLTLHSAIL